MSEPQGAPSGAPTYDRTAYRDSLFPEGRPPCIQCRQRPIYLGGLCGECLLAEAAEKRPDRERIALESALRVLGDIVRRTAGGGAEERVMQRLAGRAHNAVREVIDEYGK